MKKDIKSEGSAEVKLESEKLFLSVFDYAAIGMALVSTKGDFIKVNRSLCNLLGYKAEELTSLSFQDITHPDDLKKDLGYVRQMLDGEIDTYQMEKRYFGKRGNLVWILLSVTLCCDDKNHPQYFISQMQDITERKRAEEALHESDGNFLHIFNTVGEGVAYATLSGKVLSINPALENILGIPKEEIVGKNILILTKKLINRENLKTILPILKNVIQGKSTDLYLANYKEKVLEVCTNIDLKKKRITSVIRDITAQKRAEEKIKLFSSAVDSAYDGIIITDLNRNITYSNVSAQHIFGYKAEELMNLNSELLSASPETGAMISKEIQKKGRWRGEIISVKKNGDKFPTILSISVISDEKGIPISMMGVFRDITEQKRAEEILKLQSGAMEAATDGLAILNADYKYIYINKSHVRIYGYDNADELIGASWRILYDADELQRFNREIMPEFRQNGYYYGRALGKKKDGSTFHQAISLTSLENGGLICVVRDITKSKKIDDALKQAYNELENLHNNLDQAVFSVDMVQHKMLQVSPAHEAVYGYTPEAFFNNPMLWYEIIVPEDKPIADANYAVLYAGKLLHQEFRIMHPNGQIRWIESKIKPTLDQSGKLIRIDGIASNITDRKRAEEELKFRNVLLSAQQEASIDGILVVDENSKIISYNRRFIELWGVPLELVKNDTDEPVLEFVTNQAADPGAFLKRIQYLDKHKYDTDSDEVELRNGLIFERYTAPMIGKGDRYFGRIWYFSDITDRKKADFILREKEIQYRNLADSGTALIWTSGTDKLCNYFNKTWLKFTGRTLKQELGNGWTEGVHPDDFDRCLKIYVTSFDKRKKFDMDYRLRHISGEYRWIRDMGTPNYNSNREFVGYIGHCFDITEQKHADEELRNSRQMLEAIINAIPARVFWKDKNLNYLGCNTQFANDAGFGKPEDIIGKDDYALGWCDQAELYRADDRLVLASGNPKLLIEEPQTTPSGELIWLLTSKVPLRNANHEVMALLGTYIDITERKRVEEALHLSEARFRELYDNAKIGLYRTTPDGRILLANKVLVRMLGYPSFEKLAERNLKNEGFEPSYQRREFLERIDNDGEINEFESPWTRLDGSLLIARESTRVIRDSQGRILYYDGVVEDITQRKQVENDLVKAKQKAEESEFLLKESQKVGHIGSYKTDFTSGYWKSSETLDLIFGIDENYDRRVAGWLNIIHPEERNILNDYLINEVIAKKTVFEKEYRIVRINDQQTRWVQCFGATNFDISGNIIEMIGTIQDITERKFFEYELKLAKEHAEESDRLKSAFLANMSHEIRTPMNGILGFAGLLKEPKLTGEEQQEYISIIEQSGERMLNIINDIINISKVESGQMQVSISRTNVNEQVEYIYTFFKPEAELKGIRIFYKAPLPASEVFIQTDREKVYAILTNLVKNAIKFTQEGSVEIGCEKRGNYLEFYVRDTGSGLLPEQIEIIFERFRQVDDSLHRKFEGAGLGLSISKAYVEMLGGKIWVESCYGVGSVFYFTLPYKTEAEERSIVQSEEPIKETYGQLKHLKILIAEDDALSAKLLTNMVKKYSSEVKIVRTGVEVIETFHKFPDIDLILMDIQMPEMDGYEATRKIREFNKGVIIIAQTAFALSDDRDKAIKAGCNEYIPKPINRALLDELIGKHFSD